jgi:cation:H+ antiporter
MLAFMGLLALGTVLLYYGAEWLIRGAAGLARAFGISPLVVGLTVVSYGTSAPELIVSVLATAEGKGAIAIGNVTGSNIANIGLILGATALIAPPRVAGSLIRREVPVMLIATVAFLLVLANGLIGRIEGFCLLAGALLFTYATLRWSKRSQPEHHDRELAKDVPDTRGKLMLGLLALLGLGTLVGGGKLFVSGAVGIALLIGMSEHVVGLTVVAIGTSLPELAASLVAALRGHSEIAVGNVVGSNIFNLLLILGTASLVRPIAFPLSAMSLDASVLVAMTLLCTLAMRRGRQIGRWEGALFLSGYVAFLIAVVVAG